MNRQKGIKKQFATVNKRLTAIRQLDGLMTDDKFFRDFGLDVLDKLELISKYLTVALTDDELNGGDVKNLTQFFIDAALHFAETAGKFFEDDFE